jgi:hypothetical protein
LKSLLATAIVLKSGIGVVEPAAVCFHDQARVTPEEIDLEAAIPHVEQDVDLGAGETCATAHAEKAPLQLAARTLRGGIQFFENQAQSSDTPAPTTPAKQLAQGRVVE